jgi:hypothetical protein
VHICSLRYPDTFTTPQDTAVEIKTRCEVMIDDILKNSNFQQKRKGAAAAGKANGPKGNKKKKYQKY